MMNSSQMYTICMILSQLKIILFSAQLHDTTNASAAEDARHRSRTVCGVLQALPCVVEYTGESQ